MRTSSEIMQATRMYAGFCHSLVEDFVELATRKPHLTPIAEQATAIGKRAEACREKIVGAIEIGGIQDAEADLIVLEQAWQEMRALAETLPGA